MDFDTTRVIKNSCNSVFINVNMACKHWINSYTLLLAFWKICIVLLYGTVWSASSVWRHSQTDQFLCCNTTGSPPQHGNIRELGNQRTAKKPTLNCKNEINEATLTSLYLFAPWWPDSRGYVCFNNPLIAISLHLFVSKKKRKRNKKNILNLLRNYLCFRLWNKKKNHVNDLNKAQECQKKKVKWKYQYNNNEYKSPLLNSDNREIGINT